MRRWIFGTVCLVAMGLFGTAIAQQSFYSIHISSHKQKQKAAAEVNKLNSKGLDSFFQFVQIKNKGDWYRVYVGKYSSRKAASEDIERLRRMNISKYFAVTQVKGAPSAANPSPAAAAPVKPAASKPAPSPKAAAVNFYLFVGFYRDETLALREVDRLNSAVASRGYTALLTLEPQVDGTMYRVYIGTFEDRQAAADAGAALKRKKILKAFYIPVETPQDMIAGRTPPPATGSTSPKAAAAAAPAKSDASDAAAADRADKAAKSSADTRTGTKAAAADFSRFMVALKTGGFSPQNVDSFFISETNFTGTTIYRISDDITPQIGVEGAFRFNPYIGLYGNLDTVLLDGISWVNLSGGPLLTFQANPYVMPYLKGGAVYGNFSWSDAPGEFDPALGWEAGIGLNFLKSKFKLGLDFNYRSLSFDYKAPSDVNISASEDKLDLTGYSLMGTFSFWF